MSQGLVWGHLVHCSRTRVTVLSQDTYTGPVSAPSPAIRYKHNIPVYILNLTDRVAACKGFRVYEKRDLLLFYIAIHGKECNAWIFFNSLRSCTWFCVQFISYLQHALVENYEYTSALVVVLLYAVAVDSVHCFLSKPIKPSLTISLQPVWNTSVTRCSKA